MKRPFNLSNLSLFFLTGLLVVFGCTSFESQKNFIEFDKAVQLSQSGELEKAKQRFNKLCEQKNKTSCLIIGKKVGWRANLAIMQGPSFQGQAEFVVSGKSFDGLRAYVQDLKTNSLVSPFRKQDHSRSGSPWSLVRLSFKQLNPENPHRLLLISDQGELVDFREFNLLKKTTGLKFSVLSCINDKYDDVTGIWTVHKQTNPDAVFMIGDNSYLDLHMKDRVKGMGPDVIWRRHHETRNKVPFFRERKLKPVYAIWDDHDFGINNGGKDFKYLVDSQKIFSLFFPMPDEQANLTKGPGLARVVQLGGQQFVFLDNRSFRDQMEHFGQEQTQWALKTVKGFKGRTWLISGGQFFGGYHRFESFQGNHGKAFQKFLKSLKKAGRKVLFVSGDRHMSEVMKLPRKYLGFETFEFTSSGIHSSVHPEKESDPKNPYVLDKIQGEWNFIIFDTQVKSQKLQINLESLGQENQTFFKQSLTL